MVDQPWDPPRHRGAPDDDEPRGDVDRTPRETPATEETRSTSPNEAASHERASHERGWPRRRVLGFALAGVVLLGLIVGVTLYWLHARHFATTDDAFIDGDITQLASQVPGRVTDLLITDNQHVVAGQRLLSIDPRDFQVKLDQAKARQAQARAQLAQTQAQRTEQQAGLDQAIANQQVVAAQVFQAQRDFDRYSGLNPAAVTRQQLDGATAALREARARQDAAAQAVEQSHAQISAAEAAIAGAQATAAQSDADVEAAQLQLSYCTVVAPVAGTIAHRTVAKGNYVNAGQPLFAIVQDRVWVTANYKETQLAGLHPGTPVTVTVDAVPGVTFRARVDSFATGTGSVFSTLPAENATGNYVKIVQRVPVKITFDDDRVGQYHLSPGMSVSPSARVD